MPIGAGYSGVTKAARTASHGPLAVAGARKDGAAADAPDSGEALLHFPGGERRNIP